MKQRTEFGRADQLRRNTVLRRSQPIYWGQRKCKLLSTNKLPLAASITNSVLLQKCARRGGRFKFKSRAVAMARIFIEVHVLRALNKKDVCLKRQ